MNTTNELSPLVKAHIALATHLSQDDTDRLAGQMLAAVDEIAKRRILATWRRWLNLKITTTDARKRVEALL